MATTSYYSIGGEILGERTDAGARTNYGVDALGSVTSTLVGDAVVNRYAYKPYGSLLSKTSAGADPCFQWVGTQSYRQTGRAYATHSKHDAFYSSETARWSTNGITALEKGPTHRAANPQSVQICGVAPYLFGSLNMAPQEIKIQSAFRHTVNGCYSSLFQTTWVKPSNITLGAVIQLITYEGGVADCKTNTAACNDGGGYIEAWNITNGVLEFGGVDQFNIGCEPPGGSFAGGDCHSGSASMMGSVGWVSGCNAGPSLWTNQHHKYSGQGWSITPVPGKFIAGPSSKKLFFSFNCCVITSGYKSTAIFSKNAPINDSLGSSWSGVDRCFVLCV